MSREPRWAEDLAYPRGQLPQAVGFVQLLEDQCLKQIFGTESKGVVGKLLVFERESQMLHRSINLILVNEVLEF
jgi:hypothetical protein